MKKINVFNDIRSRENISKQKEVIKNDDKQQTQEKKEVDTETEKEVDLGKGRRKTKRK